jgi:hypothetical protein
MIPHERRWTHGASFFRAGGRELADRCSPMILPDCHRAHGGD